jgi:hypothetical protein
LQRFSWTNHRSVDSLLFFFPSASWCVDTSSILCLRRVAILL